MRAAGGITGGAGAGAGGMCGESLKAKIIRGVEEGGLEIVESEVPLHLSSNRIEWG